MVTFFKVKFDKCELSSRRTAYLRSFAPLIDFHWYKSSMLQFNACAIVLAVTKDILCLLFTYSDIVDLGIFVNSANSL
jgi:hypothetical protein